MVSIRTLTNCMSHKTKGHPSPELTHSDLTRLSLDMLMGGYIGHTDRNVKVVEQTPSVNYSLGKSGFKEGDIKV